MKVVDWLNCWGCVCMMPDIWIERIKSSHPDVKVTWYVAIKHLKLLTDWLPFLLFNQMNSIELTQLEPIPIAISWFFFSCCGMVNQVAWADESLKDEWLYDYTAGRWIENKWDLVNNEESESFILSELYLKHYLWWFLFFLLKKFSLGWVSQAYSVTVP